MSRTPSKVTRKRVNLALNMSVDKLVSTQSGKEKAVQGHPFRLLAGQNGGAISSTIGLSSRVIPEPWRQSPESSRQSPELSRNNEQ